VKHFSIVQQEDLHYLLVGKEGNWPTLTLLLQHYAKVPPTTSVRLFISTDRRLTTKPHRTT